MVLHILQYMMFDMFNLVSNFYSLHRNNLKHIISNLKLIMDMNLCISKMKYIIFKMFTYQYTIVNQHIIQYKDMVLNMLNHNHNLMDILFNNILHYL